MPTPELVTATEPERAGDIYFGLCDDDAWVAVKHNIDNGARFGTVAINNQTGTAYTIAATDLGKHITLTNVGAITLTFPQDSAVDFPIGGEVEFSQLGAGAVSVAAGSGATVRNNYTASLQGQYAVGRARKIAANTWIVSGDFATS